jgi:hypothetical protein
MRFSACSAAIPLGRVPASRATLFSAPLHSQSAAVVPAALALFLRVVFIAPRNLEIPEAIHANRRRAVNLRGSLSAIALDKVSLDKLPKDGGAGDVVDGHSMLSTIHRC